VQNFISLRDSPCSSQTCIKYLFMFLHRRVGKRKDTKDIIMDMSRLGHHPLWCLMTLFFLITLKSNKRLVPCRLEPSFPVRIVKFNWVELFTLWRLIDSMQVLPHALLTKLGKSKPNTLYTAPRLVSPRVVFLLHPSLGIYLKKRIDVGSEPFSFNFIGWHLCIAQGSSQRGLNSTRGPSLPLIPIPRLKHKQIHCMKVRPVANVVETSGMDNGQGMA